MKKIITLCMTLFMGFAIAQNQYITSSESDLIKLNKTKHQMGTKFFEDRKQAFAKQKVNRDFPGTVWVGFSEAWDLYTSNSSNLNYSWSYLWEDSTVKYAFDDNGSPDNFFWYFHSAGEVIDPGTEIFGAAYNADEWFDGQKSYTVDSLRFPYAYFRDVDSIGTSGNMTAVVDTLVVSVLFNTAIGESSLCGGGAQVPIVSYNSSTNEPASGSKIVYEQLLTIADTTSSGKVMSIDLSAYDLQKGEKIAVVLNYKAGTTWSHGDTLYSELVPIANPAGNRFMTAFYEEIVDDLPISFQLDDGKLFNQALIAFTDLRYDLAGGWNGRYIPSFAYSGPTFGLEHLVVDLLMTPKGVDFFYTKAGLYVDFFDNSNFSPTSWMWSFNDGTSNQKGGQNVNYTFPAPGSYDVCLEANNGTDYYSACKTITVDHNVGISEAENKLELRVLPNPATNQITFGINASKSERLEVIMYDILGNEVYFKALNSTAKFTDVIDLSSVSKGMYILKVKHGTRVMNKNISVIK